MFGTLVDHYAKYHNSYVKHDDAVIEEEIDFIFEITSSFMKHLIRLDNAGYTQETHYGARLNHDGIGLPCLRRPFANHADNRRSSGRLDWLAADRPTIADFACYPYVALAPEDRVPLAPAIQR